MEARRPEEFLDEVKPLLPPEKVPDSRGGRPPIRHGIVLKVIGFVLVTGCRWADVPLDMGCSGRTAHRRLRAWEASGVGDRLHAHLLRLLRKAGQLDLHTAIVDRVQVRAFGGGEATGPSPVDRGKPGSKQTLMVDRHGTPRAMRTAGAHARDHTRIIPLVLQFPHVGGKPGRPKEHSDTLYADRGYDSDDPRALLRWLGIEPVIAKRNTEQGSGLGKIRWGVERTIRGIKRLRRRRVRYDRLPIIQDAWNTLAAAVICFRIACNDCVI